MEQLCYYFLTKKTVTVFCDVYKITVLSVSVVRIREPVNNFTIRGLCDINRRK